MPVRNQIRRALTWLALLRLPRRRRRVARIPVFIVPSWTVRQQGLQYIFDGLNICQQAFEFIITPELTLRRNTPVLYSRIDILPTVPIKAATIEVRNYISQLDFYPQIDAFLRAQYPDTGDIASDKLMPIKYIPNDTLAILVGREKFIWDSEAAEYTITGDFNEDGYTILYNNDEHNTPSEIDFYNNIAVISLTKLTALPEVELELAQHGHSEEMAINDKTYVVHNTMHFLAERVFRRTIASEHVANCILRLDWTGGLFNSLVSRHLCRDCRERIYHAGVAARASRHFSCDELIDNLEAMVNFLDRLANVKRVSKVFRLGASVCFTLFGVSLLSNILVNYTNDITFIELVRRYTHPLEIAAISIGMGIICLVGFALCRWISPRRGTEI